MTCRHCNQGKASRPRGLCWFCYYRPGVREQYPSGSKYAPRHHDFNGGYGQPAQATDARPGTPEKVEVMARRAAEGVSLQHPEDGLVPRELRSEP